MSVLFGLQNLLGLFLWLIGCPEWAFVVLWVLVACCCVGVLMWLLWGLVLMVYVFGLTLLLHFLVLWLVFKCCNGFWQWSFLLMVFWWI
jgi:hypothetical protein